jgi:hypothetical protein
VEGAWIPVGSIHITSPGRPRIRLQMMRDESKGDRSVMRSPRARLLGNKRCVKMFSMTISPESANVGSMDIPDICAQIFVRNKNLNVKWDVDVHGRCFQHFLRISEGRKRG